MAWPKCDERGLARYVDPRVIERLALDANRYDLLQQLHGRRALVAAIYQRLQACAIRYATSRWQPERVVQHIRSHAELLEAPREGTCLDLAALFCGACLGYELLPLLIVTERHAFAAVSLLHGAAEWDHAARRHQPGLQDGLWHDAAALHELVQRGGYLVVECTGFAQGGGLELDFAAAQQAGARQLAQGFRFAADIMMLHRLGFGPPPPDGARIAGELATQLVQASNLTTKKSFRAVERQAALEVALDEAVAIAGIAFSNQGQRYATLLERFEAYVRREAVIEQLMRLIEPVQGAAPDLALLCDELAAVGLGAGEGVDGAVLIRALVGGFYRAAAHEPALQGAIQIGLLGELVEQIGALEQIDESSRRTAQHTEQLVERTVELVQGQRDGNALLTELAGSINTTLEQQLAVYQQVLTGLGRADIEIEIGLEGQITLQVSNTLDRHVLDQLSTMLASLRAAMQQHSPASCAALRRSYVDLLISLHGSLRLQGLSSGTRPLVLPLEQVYVQLRAVAQVPEAADAFSPEERRLLLQEQAKQGHDAADLREIQLQLDALQRERWNSKRLERFPIGRALADPQQRGLVILGDPGSGKSTLLQFLALAFAQGPARATALLGVQGAEAARLPILVPLASYDALLDRRPDLTLRDFLPYYYDQRRELPGLAPVFAQALDAGQALVLLDGLDEVLNDHRRTVVADQLNAFIRVAIARGNRVVVTSRIYGYRVAPLWSDLPHITVLDFGCTEIELFARQWYRAFVAWEHGSALTPQLELAAQREERALLANLRASPGVERLAVNPLLLTMLVLLRRQIGQLPQRRIQLYHRYITTLIETWENDRSRGERPEKVRCGDPADAKRTLIELALWLQHHHPSGTATRADLLGWLTRHYLPAGQPAAPHGPPDTPQQREAAARAERFLHDMRQFSGLLIERGQGAFGFRHLTFQEYFASWALARMPSEERWALLEGNLHSNRWREPLLLAAARLGVSELRDSEASALVAQVLHAGSPHEQQLHRDLFLAADCAADDIGATPALLDEIVAGLRALLDARVPALGLAALRRLFRLSLLKVGEQPRLPELVELLGAQLWDRRQRYRELLQEALQAHPQIYITVLHGLSDQRWLKRWVAVAALAPLVTTDPVVQGALRERLADGDWQVRQAAVQALAPLVTTDPALQGALRERLADMDRQVRQAVVQALAPLVSTDPVVYGVVRACLADAASDVRKTAVETLAPLVPTDPDVQRTLRECLADIDWQVRQAVVQALAPLVSTDSEVHGVLRACLADADSDVQQAAVTALAPLAEGDVYLRHMLCGYVADRASNVRTAAIEQLQRYYVTDSQVRHAIQQALQHGTGRTRQAAMAALLGDRTHTNIQPDQLLAYWRDFRCGEAASGRAALIAPLKRLSVRDHQGVQLVQRIVVCLTDTYGRVRLAAVAALAPLVGSDAMLRAAVQERLADENWQVRQAAVAALAPLVGSDALMQAAIQERLVDTDDAVRAAAVAALAPLSCSDAMLRGAIQECLADADNDVRAAAVAALARLVTSYTDLRAALLERFADEEDDVWSATVAALAPLVTSHADLRAAIQERLTDTNWSVRQAAVTTLAPLVASDTTLRAAIQERLADTNWSVRQAAVTTLAPFVASDPTLRTLLQKRLADADWEGRQVAVQMLASLVGSDMALRAAIQDCLADTDRRVRQAAVVALAPLAGSDVALCVALRERLADANEWVRCAAVTALAPLAGSDAALLSAVRECLADENWQVRQAAVAALAPLVGSNIDLRIVIQGYLSDAAWRVRQAAVVALAPLAASNSDLRMALLDCLADESAWVRQVAIEELAPFAANDAALRAAFQDCLADAEWLVRRAAVKRLLPLISTDAELYDRLLPLLGREDALQSFMLSQDARLFHTHLVASYGEVVRNDPQRRAEAIALLGHVDWRLRKAGALLLAEAGVEALQEARQPLLDALDDARGLEAQAAHVTLAGLLINDDRYSADVIAVIVRALDYDADAIFPLHEAATIRQHAALALGKLKAAYCTPELLTRVLALLEREQDPRVLDSLHAALGALVAAPELE